MAQNLGFQVNLLSTYDVDGYDSIILIHCADSEGPSELVKIRKTFLEYDKALENETAVIPLPDLSAKRLIHAPAGPLDPDYDDVRSLGEAAKKGIQRAIKAGSKSPILILPSHGKFKNSDLVTLLGALEALYVPIQMRECPFKSAKKIEKLGVYSENDCAKEIINAAIQLESGRIVARDIGGGDPERMAPPKVQTYVQNLFKNSEISVRVIDDLKVLQKEYPLFAAVDRCARQVERHYGRIIFLEYNPPEKINRTVMLVGKGVTYDTGGADIKAGGIMAGMSRDKCGAAAVAGFMQIVNLAKPKDLKVVAAMCMVRNSVGSDCYVSDELISARAGVTVRIGNTDAEGRTCMVDVLCQMKELAKNEVNPHLYTIATLTGHAVLAAGEGYSIVIDNGPARNTGHAQKLQNHGAEIGDPFEVSMLRREDIAFHRGKAEGDDVLQCNNLASSRTPRGHQTPAGFLLLASGLDKHGSGSEQPIPYSHLDIAGSAGEPPKEPTGAPVLALAKLYLQNAL